MPLWQIFHPENIYTEEDKKALSERITALYARIPIPKFYVVVLFHEVAAASFYVGGEKRSDFVRFKIDQMARTMTEQIYREWWMRRVEDTIAPFVTERGLESEVQIAELGHELWTFNGVVPPPFESIAEKKWVEANKVIPYSEDEKIRPRG